MEGRGLMAAGPLAGTQGSMEIRAVVIGALELEVLKHLEAMVSPQVDIAVQVEFLVKEEDCKGGHTIKIYAYISVEAAVVTLVEGLAVMLEVEEGRAIAVFPLKIAL